MVPWHKGWGGHSNQTITVQVVLKVTHKRKNMNEIYSSWQNNWDNGLHRTFSNNIMFLCNVLVSNLREQFKTSTRKKGLPNNDTVKMFYHMTTKSLRVSWQIPMTKCIIWSYFVYWYVRILRFVYAWISNITMIALLIKKMWILCSSFVIFSPTTCWEHPN